MARTIITINKPAPKGQTVPTSLILDEGRKRQIINARTASGQTWPEWYRLAIERLLKESSEEVASLLESTPPANTESAKISLRIYESDVEKTQNIADQYQVPMRNVALMALSMQMLSVDLAKD